MVEEILLNLPVKSLLRFSTASKSWNSTIFNSGFVKRYRRRAARVRIALVRSFPEKPSSCLISSLSSNNPIVDATATATDFVFQFGGRDSVVAACDDLWLSRDGNSFYLWNPSMRSFKKLPEPSSMPNDEVKFVLGLGYESVGDDYKILRLPRCSGFKADMYSLRSDSWKSVEYLLESKHFLLSNCVFVSGNLHWLCGHVDAKFPYQATIVRFDLLTEKSREVALPANCAPRRRRRGWGLGVLRGMLCVSVSHAKFCEVWVMKEYGVVQSWTKMINIVYFKTVVKGTNRKREVKLDTITPLYLNEDGEILVSGSDGRHREKNVGVSR